MSQLDQLESIDDLLQKDCTDILAIDKILRKNYSLINDCLDEYEALYLKCCVLREQQGIEGSAKLNFCNSQDELIIDSSGGADIAFFESDGTNFYFTDFINQRFDASACCLELTGTLKTCFRLPKYIESADFEYTQDIEIRCGTEVISTSTITGSYQHNIAPTTTPTPTPTPTPTTPTSLQDENFKIGYDFFCNEEVFKVPFFVQTIDCDKNISYYVKDPVIQTLGTGVELDLNTEIKNVCVVGDCA